MSKGVIEAVPTVEKPLVYLDHNIYVLASKDNEVYRSLRALADCGQYVFPYTHVHMAEVNRIRGSVRETEVKKHLSIFREITSSQYLDYRQELGAFTVRVRDPFEVFEAINQVPREYIDQISKLAADQYLIGKIDGFPEHAITASDQYQFFAEEFRRHHPDLGKKLNNLTREEAKRFLEQECFQRITFEHAFDLFMRSQDRSTSILKDVTLEFFIDSTLFLAGFRTPNSDLERSEGLLSDHQHLKFCKCLHDCLVRRQELQTQSECLQ